MGGLDVAAHGGGDDKKKGVLSHKKKGRGRIAIDMTPFVDIAFLLLIFFMVTTVFRQPQALEMNLPPADTTVQVAESNVLTLFVDPAVRMFYKIGRGSLTSTTMKDLNSLFTENAKLNPELVIPPAQARPMLLGHLRSSPLLWKTHHQIGKHIVSSFQPRQDKLFGRGNVPFHTQQSLSGITSFDGLEHLYMLRVRVGEVVAGEQVDVLDDPDPIRACSGLHEPGSGSSAAHAPGR